MKTEQIRHVLTGHIVVPLVEIGLTVRRGRRAAGMCIHGLAVRAQRRSHYSAIILNGRRLKIRMTSGRCAHLEIANDAVQSAAVGGSPGPISTISTSSGQR